MTRILNPVFLKGDIALNKAKDYLSFIKGNVAVLLASFTLFRVGFSVVYGFTSVYIISLGGTPAIVGLINATSTFIATAVGVPGGYIADYKGRYRIISVMTFTVAIATLLYSLAINWQMFLTLAIFEAFCHIYLPALRAIEADSLPPAIRGFGYALIRMLPSIPAVIGPYIGGWLYQNYEVAGLRYGYLIAAACGFAAASLRYKYLRETLLMESETSKIVSSKKLLENSFIETFSILKQVPRSLACLAMVESIIFLANWTIGPYIILYALNIIKVGALEWGFIGSVAMATNIIFAFITGHIIDKWGRRRPLIISLLASTPLGIYLTYCESFPQLLLTMTLLTAASSPIFLAIPALLADLTPRERRGRVNASLSLITTSVSSSSFILGGILYETNPAYPFLLFSATLPLAALITITLVKEPEKKEL